MTIEFENERELVKAAVGCEVNVYTLATLLLDEFGITLNQRAQDKLLSAQNKRENERTLFLTWKMRDTPQKRLYFQLVPSMPRTGETGSRLLPTPVASDANGTHGGNMHGSLQPRIILLKKATVSTWHGEKIHAQDSKSVVHRKNTEFCKLRHK